MRGTAAAALALLAVALVGLQWQSAKPNVELLSRHIADAEIRAQRSLDSFWTRLDQACLPLCNTWLENACSAGIPPASCCAGVLLYKRVH